MNKTTEKFGLLNEEVPYYPLISNLHQNQLNMPHRISLTILREFRLWPAGFQDFNTVYSCRWTQHFWWTMRPLSSDLKWVSSGCDCVTYAGCKESGHSDSGSGRG